MRWLGAFLGLLLPAGLQAAWTVDLNHKDLALYEKGDEAFVVLHWSGDSAAPPAPGFALYDELGRKLKDLAPRQEGASWKADLPTERNGYFEIRPSERAEEIIPALGSRPGGFLSFAVVDQIDRNPSRDFQEGFLSSQGTTILRKKDGQNYGWDALPYLGVQSQGLGYSWGQLEAGGPGAFDQSIANDRQPEWVRELKIVPYFHLNGIPMWAADASRLPEKERAGKSTQRIPPRDWKLWEEYLEKIVPYIAKKYDFLPERIYEIMWEPVIPWGWYGTNEEIVKTFEIAHKVIRKHDPKGLVAGPTSAGLGDVEQYEALLQAGLGNYLDVFAMHNYRGYPPEKSAIPEGLAALRQTTRGYLDRDLRMIGTEAGYQDTSAGSPLNKSYGLTASVLIFKGEGLAKHTLFYLTDYAGEPGYGMMYNLVDSQPFGPAKASPKPAIPMIRAAIDQIGHAENIGKIDYLGADIWGYVFKDKETNTLFAALWDASDKARTITFDTGEPEVEVVDLYGNSEKRSTVDGQLSLSLGRGPVYVRGLSSQLYGPGRIALLIETADVWPLYRGRPVSEKVALTRKVGEGEGKLTFDTAADIYRGRVQLPISLLPESSAELAFDVAKTAPLGPAPGYLRIQQNGKPVYRGVQRLEVLPELQITPPSAVLTNGQWQVATQIKNISPYPWKGEVSLRIETGPPQTQPLDLAAGAERSLTFDTKSSNSIKLSEAHVDAVSAEGVSLAQEGRLTFFVMQKRPPGEDFWAKLRLTDIRVTDESIWKSHPDASFRGDQDLAASIGYAYDDENLYVHVIVADDRHRQEAAPGATWSQDSLQLAFDLQPGRADSGNTLAESHERSTSEWTFAWTARGPEIFLPSAPGSSIVPGSALVSFPGASLEGGPADGKTVYRVMLPWKLLDPKNTRNRQQIGIAAAVNDSDVDIKNSDRRGLEFFGGILRGKNPQLFGKAQLE
jgi:hypothetical protein